MTFLSNSIITTHAVGKAILIGEHAVVYGYKAVAVALPDVQLKMTLFPPDKSIGLKSWGEVWQTIVREKEFEPEEHIKSLLLKAFEKALNICKVTENVNNFSPQKILINSDLPLGGGMGGSAAISTCFLKLALQIALQKKTLEKEFTLEQLIYYANEIDCLFHFGKASGIDVTTVISNSIISFSREDKHNYIKNGKEFWIALIDSEERGETALMVKRVVNRFELYPIETKKCMENLGELAEQSIHEITKGNIVALAKNLNLAQINLSQLGVSTPKIDEIILTLKNAGALAAKLTGAGGGGLVLGIFEQNPKQLLYNLFDNKLVFVTRVPKYEK